MFLCRTYKDFDGAYGHVAQCCLEQPRWTSLDTADERTLLTLVLVLHSLPAQKFGHPDPDFQWHEKERLAVLRAIQTCEERDCLFGFEVSL